MKTLPRHSRQIILILFLLSSLSISCAGQTDKPKFFADPGSTYPFSLAVKAGELIFVSGVLGTDKDGKLDPDFKKQSVLVMENIKARVEKLGYTMKDIVKCTVMIRDMSKWADFNAIYKTYFEPGKYPARSAMGVSGLALGAEMEVEAILYAPGK
jgi:reactive intermediate/imine deaminase